MRARLRAIGLGLGALALSASLTCVSHARQDGPQPDSGDSASAFELLQKMSHAGMTLSYDAHLVYTTAGRIEPMRVIYRGGPEGTKARMISLSGEAREVIIDSSSVICILPANQQRLQSVGKSRRSAMFSRLSEIVGDERRQKQIQTSYSLSVQRGERVAGRQTIALAVEPRDSFRYPHRFYVDEETGLVLRSLLLDANEKILEEYVYIDFELLDEVPDEWLEPSLRGKSFDLSISEVAAPLIDSLAAWTAAGCPKATSSPTASSTRERPRIGQSSISYSPMA